MSVESVETPSVAQFLKHIQHELTSHEIKLRFAKAVDRDLYAGWFDNVAKEMVVVRSHPRWLETLVHEYSHFLQYREGHELFVRTADRGQFWLQQCALRGENGVNGGICRIVHGLSQSQKYDVIEKVLCDVQQLELDVAPRGKALVARFSLPIDMQLFIACTLRNVQQWRFEIEGNITVVPKPGLRISQSALDRRTIEAFGCTFQNFIFQTLTAPQRQYFHDFYQTLP
jgi:hypothetical protein